MPNPDRFNDYIRAGSLGVALLAVAYLATVQHSEQATGALIGLVSLAASFLFRGKVQPPTKE